MPALTQVSERGDGDGHLFVGDGKVCWTGAGISRIRAKFDGIDSTSCDSMVNDSRLLPQYAKKKLDTFDIFRCSF